MKFENKETIESNEIIKDVKVYGIEESFKASKYPKSIDIETCNSEVTDTIHNLANSKIGSGHDQFLTGIIVQFNLTFSLKAWTEAERYHFFDFVSSQSTMHRITKLNPEKQCNKYVDERLINILKEKINSYNENQTSENYLDVLYNIPSGFRLTARMTTNYRQLKTIYHQRRSHKLPEWRKFCGWIETLPYFQELILN